MYKNGRYNFHHWKYINVEYDLFHKVVIFHKRHCPSADAIGEKKPRYNAGHQPQNIRKGQLRTEVHAHTYCLIKHKPVNQHGNDRLHKRPDNAQVCACEFRLEIVLCQVFNHTAVFYDF